MDETKPVTENLEATAPVSAAPEETPAAADTTGKNLDFILDIPLRVSVELGRTKILVQDLLKLHKGSVMELNKLAGEPLEVLVNNRVVARGEVIVINEKFGIRLTDIVNHAERIRELGAAA
jgi:flagellar motor switch protein FliN